MSRQVMELEEHHMKILIQKSVNHEADGEVQVEGEAVEDVDEADGEVQVEGEALEDVDEADGEVQDEGEAPKDVDADYGES